MSGTLIRGGTVIDGTGAPGYAADIRIADGMIVEVHPCPEKAVSDGAQSLTIPGFEEMMHQLKGYLELWKQERLATMAVAV